MKLTTRSASALVLLFLLCVFPLIGVNVATSATAFSNPSVIPGSAAALNGPRVSEIKYTVYSSDAVSLGSVLSGTNEIVDRPLSTLSDIQTAVSTNFMNVTSEAGASSEFLIFNMYNSSNDLLNAPPGYFLPFRQAMAHLINYSYIQNTVLNGIQGIATPELFLHTSFVGYSPTNFTIYTNSLLLANQSLAKDPQIAYSSTDSQPAPSNTIACKGARGVWEYATTLGSGKPNGTAFEPQLFTRPDHPTWFTWAQEFWNSGAELGLCIDLRQFASLSAVYEIVFKQYSSNWAMYDSGQTFIGVLDVLGTAYFGYTAVGFPDGPSANVNYFNNATITKLLKAAYDSPNATLAGLLTTEAIADIQQQVPSVGLWWDNYLIPSLNNFDGKYWAGYVNVPGFSTYQTGSQYYTSLNVHQVDPTTGKTIVGGTFDVAQHQAPGGLNALNDNNVYSEDVYNMIYWDSPEIYTPNNPTLGGLIPWMLTGQPTSVFDENASTPHGYNMVNGMAITMNFMKNITFSDNVPFTASDYNFSLWYINPNGAIMNASKYGIRFGGCNMPCWTKYANNVALRFTGGIPDIIDSQVSTTNPYQMTVYVNNTDIEDYYATVDSVVIPQHIWSKINSTALTTNDVQPGQVSNMPLEAGVGGFEFGQSDLGQFSTVYRFPGYFKTDVVDWSLNGYVGSPIPLSLNITTMGINGPPVPIPTNAKVTAWIDKNGNSLEGNATTLTLSGNSWIGSLPTTGLSSGFYEITANGTYTGNDGLFHTALQFWGLNLSNGSNLTASSLSSRATSQSEVAASPTISSDSSPTGNATNYLIIAPAFIIFIIIAGVAIYVIRSRK